MSSPDAPESLPHSPQYACEEAPLATISASSTPAASNQCSAEAANSIHMPHTLRPIIEVQDAASPNSDSGDEVTYKLKGLVERQAGTTMARNRDTIDSILSKYSYELESERNTSTSKTGVELNNGCCENSPDQHSTTIASDDFKRVLKPVPAPDVDTTRATPHAESQILRCPHCEDNFRFSHAGNILRVVALEQVEAVPHIPVSIVDHTDSSFESVDMEQPLDGSSIVADGTTMSTFDHGTAPPSETEINESSGYLPRKSSINHDEESPLVDAQALNEGSLRGSVASSEASASHTPQQKDGGIEEILEEHWTFLEKQLVTRVSSRNDDKIDFESTSIADVAEEVSENDFSQIGMLVQNLEDIQKLIGLPHDNKTAFGNEDTWMKEIDSSDKTVDVKRGYVGDTTRTMKEVGAVIKSTESTKRETEKDKSVKLATTGYTDMLDGDLGAEKLLTGTVCTMFGLVFAAGALST